MQDDSNRSTRRELLARGALLAGGAWLTAAARAAVPWSQVAADDAAEQALDAALERIHAGEPCPHGGLSSHAPMGVEALVAMGFAAQVPAWLERDERRERRSDLPGAGRVAGDAWQGELGSGNFLGWRARMVEELREARWQEVLERWATRLAPGFCAAAMHGPIRTAHAARALGRRETPPRRAELARGLAYWASWYQELPGRAAAPAESCEASLLALPLHRAAHGAAPGGNLVNGLRSAARLEGFPAPGGVAALEAPSPAALTAMTAAMARSYLRHGTRSMAIGFVHGLTGPAAVRKLAAHVPDACVRTLLPFAWQASQGIHAAYADPTADAAKLQLAAGRSPAQIAAAAAEDGDVHVIKFAEALLAEHALHDDPACLAAAEDIPLRL